MRATIKPTGSGTLLGLLVVSLVTACTPLCGAPHTTGQGKIPKQSIVRVSLNHAFEGILLKDQYIPQPTVFEVSEFTGVVLSRTGHVVSYLGDYWPAIDQVQEAQAKVQTLDGRAYPATILGIDRRLSLLVLRSDLPADTAVETSSSPETDHFNVVTLGDREMMVGAPCVRHRERKEWLPSAELKVSGLDLELCSWTGGVALDPDGGFLGLVTRVEAHPFSKKLTNFQLLPGSTIQASVRVVESAGKSAPAGWLGVNLVQEGDRILVAHVVPESPAEKGGVTPSDVIVKLDSNDVTFADLVTAIRWKGPGATVKLSVERNGQLETLPVTLEERRVQPKLAWAIQFPERVVENQEVEMAVKFYKTVMPPILDLGFVVEHLSEQLARKLQSPQPGGLLVTSIRGGSPAEQAGFLAGDVLFVINGQAIFKVSDVQKSLQRSQDKFIEIRFVRDGRIRQKRISLP